MTTLILLRHGQSLWNQQKTFTGWTDIGLSEQGRADAEAVGRLLLGQGFKIDVCFSSVLLRATETLRLVLRSMGSESLPIQEDWRLNERHYGALQGLSFWDAVRQFGLSSVLRCQRRYGIRPPALPPGDNRFPGHDPRYADLVPSDLPGAESLHDTLLRLLPCWEQRIVPELRPGRCVLVVSHRNLLRSLIKHLTAIPDSQAPRIKVPTATPLIYQLDDQLRVVGRQTLKREA